jgi:hypothetical protein
MKIYFNILGPRKPRNTMEEVKIREKRMEERGNSIVASHACFGLGIADWLSNKNCLPGPYGGIQS